MGMICISSSQLWPGIPEAELTKVKDLDMNDKTGFKLLSKIQIYLPEFTL